MTLLAMWMLYTIFGVAFFSLIFLWAVRTRQFTDQDEARYLPLDSDPPAEAATAAAPARAAGRISPVLYVPAGLILFSLVLLGGTGWYMMTH